MTFSRNATSLTAAPLLEHLEELRLRIIYVVVFWAIGTGVAWVYHNQLFAFLRSPLDAHHLTAGTQVAVVALRLTDQLTTAFQISAFGGVALALPFIVYQIWAFVAPALTKTERRWGTPFILGVGFSFALGVVFADLVIFPYAVSFLLGGFLEGVSNNLTIAEYIGDVLMYLGMFGLLFELPITMYLLSKIGLLNPKLLSSLRRYAILGIFAASALLTPTTDLVNMLLMAVPMLGLYEFGIVLSAVAVKQNARARKDSEAAHSAGDIVDQQ